MGNIWYSFGKWALGLVFGYTSCPHYVVWELGCVRVLSDHGAESVIITTSLSIIILFTAHVNRT